MRATGPATVEGEHRPGRAPPLIRRLGRSALPALALAGVLACGGSKDAPVGSGASGGDAPGRDGSSSAAPGPAASSSSSGTPTGAAETLLPMEVTGSATDTIELRSEGPTLQFLPDRLTATAGELVLLRFTNDGELPHNFALFRSDDAVDARVYEAYEAAATGYIPVGAKDDLVAYAMLVSPGETAEMEFVVPPPGRYTFICLFPGHAQMMLGTFTSRE